MPNRNKNDSYQALIQAVSRAAWRHFDYYDENGENSFDTSVIHTFPDAVILMNTLNEKLYEASYLINGNDIVFSQLLEVQETYVAKRAKLAGIEIDVISAKASKRSPEIGGPIVKKNAAQRIAYAAVLVPGEPDSDGEVLTAEKIEEVAHGWMESYRNVDLMHTLNNVGLPVESYILNQSMDVDLYGQKTTLPVGTWILASKLSQETWGAVESGILRGYSVMGIKRMALESAAKSKEALCDTAFKRTLLADLGPDWVAAFVSVVDEPAVPKAKFFSLKCAAPQDKPQETIIETTNKDKSLFAKIKEALKIGVKSTEDVTKKEEVNVVDEKDNLDLTNLIQEAVKSALGPVVERLDKLEVVKSLEVPETVEETVETPDSEETKVDTVVEKPEEGTKEVPEVVKPEETVEKSEGLDESFKAMVLEKLEALTSKKDRKNTASKSIDVLTADPDKKVLDHRDSFGRKRKVV